MPEVHTHRIHISMNSRIIGRVRNRTGLLGMGLTAFLITCGTPKDTPTTAPTVKTEDKTGSALSIQTESKRTGGTDLGGIHADGETGSVVDTNDAKETRPPPTNPEASEIFARLVALGGDEIKKGKAITGATPGELTLVLSEGELPFDVLLPLSEKIACATAKMTDKKEAVWRLFEGPEPVGLQLTRTSATYYRYSSAKKCLVALPMWEASFKEKGAAVLLEWTLSSGGASISSEDPSDENAAVQRSTRTILDELPLEAEKGWTIQKELILGKPTDTLTADFTMKRLRILDANKRELLVHPLPKGFTILRTTVLKNRRGERFAKIEVSDPGAGADCDGMWLAYTVYELIPDDKAIQTTVHRDEAEWWGKSATAEDDRNKRMTRYYKTPFGTIRHEVTKVSSSKTRHSDDIPTYVDKATARNFPKLCPPKPGYACRYEYKSNKRVTSWRFEPTGEGMSPVKLLEQDWSEKTVEKVTYLPNEE